MTPETRELTIEPRWGLRASLVFWCGVALETLARRSFTRVLEGRRRGRCITASGLEAVPLAGGLVFSVNHYHAGLTLDVVSATLLAAARVRLGVSDQCTVVVGQRAALTSPSRRRKFVRWLVQWFFERWGANVLRIPVGVGPGGVAELRAWRRRAARAPMLVFPEGVANRELGGMRAGTGRWLRGLAVPVVPVGVWWGKTGWQVAFGAPIAWTARRELQDLQLGLAMAELLPTELAPSWIDLLARWRAAHLEAAPRSVPHAQTTLDPPPPGPGACAAPPR